MSDLRYFNGEMVDLFKNVLRFNKTNLRSLIPMLRIVWHQKRAYNRRVKSKFDGVQIPPIIVWSVTKNCNLNCKACYQKAQERVAVKEMDEEKIKSVLKEANGLGSSVVLFLGGEPLTRKDIFNITGSFKNMIFGIFTNGLLIDDAVIRKFKKNRNIIPIISLEGNESETDQRRGTGVYSHAVKIASQLKANNIAYGMSFTVTHSNCDIVSDDAYIRNHIKSGCKFFFFVDYVPINGCHNEMILTQEQHEKLKVFYSSFRKKYKAYCLAPSVEQNIGGCLGAGRGLIHINFDGSVEPCPFAPISDSNLFNTSFKDALKSELFHKIRENHDNLEGNKQGSCSLWENRELIETYKSN